MKDPFNTARPRSIFMAAGLFLCFAILAPAGWGQDDVIRIETSLVSVPFSAVDREGRSIIDLKKENIAIFEDGVEQKIDFLNSVDESITVLMLLDISSSMRGHYDMLLAAANTFVKQLRPHDRLIAMSFNDYVKTVVPGTLVSELQTGIRLKPKVRGGGTILYDAVDAGINKIEKVQGRKAVILFTDGMGSGIKTAKGTLRDAEEGEAPFYTVRYGTFAPAPPRGRNNKFYLERVAEIEGYMRDLAVKTGGRPYHIADISDLEATFRQVALELSRQYTLGYYPSRDGKDGERRKITVKVNVPNVAVRSRNEVIYKKPKRDIR